MTLYITLKSGGFATDTASNMELDVKNGVLTINVGTKQERVFSFSLLNKVEVVQRGY